MKQRVEFVMRALKAENFRGLCQEYGISAKTGYKWLERFKQHGRVGLGNESRKPRSHAHALSEEVICEIVRLKKLKPNWGPSKIRSVYARLHEDIPSESSFKRVLDRAGSRVLSPAAGFKPAPAGLSVVQPVIAELSLIYPGATAKVSASKLGLGMLWPLELRQRTELESRVRRAILPNASRDRFNRSVILPCSI